MLILPLAKKFEVDPATGWEKFDVDPASMVETFGVDPSPVWVFWALFLPLDEKCNVYSPPRLTSELCTCSVESYCMMLIMSLAACLKPGWLLSTCQRGLSFFPNPMPEKLSLCVLPMLEMFHVHFCLWLCGLNFCLSLERLEMLNLGALCLPLCTASCLFFLRWRGRPTRASSPCTRATAPHRMWCATWSGRIRTMPGTFRSQDSASTLGLLP